jgi:hypothetical protein
MVASWRRSLLRPLLLAVAAALTSDVPGVCQEFGGFAIF